MQNETKKLQEKSSAVKKKIIKEDMLGDRTTLNTLREADGLHSAENCN